MADEAFLLQPLEGAHEGPVVLQLRDGVIAEVELHVVEVAEARLPHGLFHKLIVRFLVDTDPFRGFPAPGPRRPGNSAPRDS